MTDTSLSLPSDPAGDTRDRHMTHLALAVALFGLLFSVYLFSFSGTFSANDERWLFDITESIAKRGDLTLNQTTSLGRGGTEPAQSLLAAPLYLVANQLDSVGNVQTTFLFNPIVTALTSVLLYFFVLQLGYSRRDALLAGVLFGLTTIAWPYSRTFFREPLATLSLLASFMFIDRWRKSFGVESQKRQIVWLTLAAAAYVVSALTKEVALVAAPLLAAYAVPSLQKLRANKRSLLIMSGGLLVMTILLLTIVLLLKSGDTTLSSRYNVSEGLRTILTGLNDAGTGIRGFLISPGRSVFVYSPIALLSVAALFIRDPKSRRERWLAIGMLLAFTIFYAAGRPTVWFGGSNWGPRFLVPVTPFLILGSMPLLKRGLDAASRWPTIGLAILALLSVVVQVGGSFINFHDYLGTVRVTNSIWRLTDSPALGHLRLLTKIQWDVIWARPSVDGVALGVPLLGILISGGLLAWQIKRPITKRLAGLAVGGSLTLMIITSGVVLTRAYDDPKYLGDNADLHALVNYLEVTATSQEPILLANNAFLDFFANYYKGDSVWYTMPHSPGERHSAEEIALVTSDDPEELTNESSKALIRTLDDIRPFWLIEDSGPFLPWNPRPPEWWAAEHYYTVRTEEFAPAVRAIRYLRFPAPDQDTPPTTQIDVRLGNNIVLNGYDLSSPLEPDATTFRHSDELGLSLVWAADATPQEDFIAAVFIFSPDGQLIWQMDRTPVATFRPTTSWQTGEIIRDNYGFTLPADLPLGQYQIMTAMYRWPSQERLPITSAQGEPLGDLLTIATFELIE